MILQKNAEQQGIMDSIGFQKSANSFQRVGIAVTILTDVSLFCPTRLTI